MISEPTVFIVDDDPAVIRVLTELVQLIDLRVKSYGSADEFIKAYKPTGPACLVLDVRMPGMSGLELQKRLLETGMAPPIIMITGHGDVRMAVEAMNSGAVNFLEKPFRTQELCDNIQRAVRLDEDRWREHLRREEADRRMANLTDAERGVMNLVVAGKTNKMMADELGLSIRAVGDRRARMMKKLGAKSRAELRELATAAEPSS